MQAHRRTIVVPDRLAYRQTRFLLAQRGVSFTHVVTLPALAAQLAGGLLRAASALDMLTALRNAPLPELVAFADVSALPGFSRAAISSVQTLWSSGATPDDYPNNPRYADVWRIAQHIEQQLPPGTVPLPALVFAAQERTAFAAALTGAVTLTRVGTIPAVYRPLFAALAETVPVTWHAPFSDRPKWWPTAASFVPSDTPNEPHTHVVQTAHPGHEMVAALRWAREQIASGVAPGDIAIAAADLTPYEATLRALTPDLDVPLHFANGTSALTHPHGRRAAALAAAWLSPGNPDTNAFLNEQFGGEAPSIAAEAQATPRTMKAGIALGESVLRDTARDMWVRALEEAPPALLEATLKQARTDDQTEPTTAAVVCSAEQLTGSPRPHVYLLGLNAGVWPRKSGQDPLLPHDFAHAGPTRAEQDENDFNTILRTTQNAVLSSNRRNNDGQVLTGSPLLDAFSPPVELSILPATAHALSEYDRRFLTPSETQRDALLNQAQRTWTNWHVRHLTEHDGIVRRGNKRLLASTKRRHSATSLSLLIRDPLVFLWRYALGVNEPEWVEPLMMSPQDFGTLVHEVLEESVRALEADGGFAQASEEQIATAIRAAVAHQRAVWPSPPPKLLFDRVLHEAEQFTHVALTWPIERFPGQTSETERSFGRHETVHIPGTDLRIQGVIDRLDRSEDGTQVRVIDYKTGGSKPGTSVEDGAELQRVLYRFAVQALLPDATDVRAYLFNPRFPNFVPLANETEADQQVVTAVTAALQLLEQGTVVPGPNAGRFQFGKLAFPANQGRYLAWKGAEIEHVLYPIAAAFGGSHAE